MEHTFDRLPAIPLIVNDPYFSIWLPADHPASATTVHWSGAEKPIYGYLTVDGKNYLYLGRGGLNPARVTDVRVTPTRTAYVFETDGVRLTVTFWSPALPDDLDALSTPITFVDYEVCSVDGAPHTVCVQLQVTDTLCYDGGACPAINADIFNVQEVNVCRVGQAQQKILCHSGDRITIDWGYLYVATDAAITRRGESTFTRWETTVEAETQHSFILLGYDDISSINYYGVPTLAWYKRSGKSFVSVLDDFYKRHNALLRACARLDVDVLADAERVAGEDYCHIISAAWRQTFGAHKLIAAPDGSPVLLAKENDSCGCLGTVDVSYPSCPIFLRYCPDLVNALCRPVLEFASMPVWKYDYAPHDVGRYPYASGQFYALRDMPRAGEVLPPLYQYPADADLYDPARQMPLEESSDLIIMLEAAISYGADISLAKTYAPLLERWANYLAEYGEDPENQLCTDDFAGHSAHNVNLSVKAIVGMACYARLLARFDSADAALWRKKAVTAAQHWLERVDLPDGTPLSFDGSGWSLKYNLVWDKVLDLKLLPAAFYEAEMHSYLKHQNRYGLPLDSRAAYTKSDWICWIAAMAEPELRLQFLKPLADYLRTSTTRVPFSDWYNSVTGEYESFIARSVQGGVFMPMLAENPRQAPTMEVV